MEDGRCPDRDRDTPRGWLAHRTEYQGECYDDVTMPTDAHNSEAVTPVIEYKLSHVVDHQHQPPHVSILTFMMGVTWPGNGTIFALMVGYDTVIETRLGAERHSIS